MSKSNHKQPALPCPPYTHPLPKPLADVLRHRYGERYTRYNAFRYLLEKQALHLWAEARPKRSRSASPSPRSRGSGSGTATP